MNVLEGKRVLVTGVLTRRSIAYAIAERALALGATLTLTSFGRVRRMTERAARGLDCQAPILEFDALDDRAAEQLAEQLGDTPLDGVVHAIAFAPPGAIAGDFLSVPPQDAEIAFRASAYSLNALARATQPALRAAGGGAMVGLDFDASLTWPAYNWMGVSKAALESVNRYLARELGAAGIRVNLISAGPLNTVATSAFEGFSGLAAAWEMGAPLGWDSRDPSPVADVACTLLSDSARGVTGSVVHVDGGVHVLGGGLVAPGAHATARAEP